MQKLKHTALQMSHNYHARNNIYEGQTNEETELEIKNKEYGRIQDLC
jgi:hypothetical protein